MYMHGVAVYYVAQWDNNWMLLGRLYEVVLL